MLCPPIRGAIPLLVFAFLCSRITALQSVVHRNGNSKVQLAKGASGAPNLAAPSLLTENVDTKAHIMAPSSRQAHDGLVKADILVGIFQSASMYQLPRDAVITDLVIFGMLLVWLLAYLFFLNTSDTELAAALRVQQMKSKIEKVNDENDTAYEVAEQAEKAEQTKLAAEQVNEETGMASEMDAPSQKQKKNQQTIDKSNLDRFQIA